LNFELIENDYISISEKWSNSVVSDEQHELPNETNNMDFEESIQMTKNDIPGMF
jgi:hypothetical protein